ncbi:carboxypeptidase regulatory-like domain-containing protein [Bacteroides sp. 519]|uniref:carboxypeptidase regulatory-like domain-containing protein n=1 Tax=Bacteroides sp. 519 TaxID=2302937 RepID=UPI0013D4EB78|nr:carboxypeptidase regulatory-like domain-containing protein [Bacteroides sp. 519]
MNKFLQWGLLCCAALSMNSCAFGDDEKDIEIVDDPMTETEVYYIAGTVYDAGTATALSGVKVEANGESVTTESDGQFQFEVPSKKDYTVTFSKDKYLGVNAEVTIASSAANRSLVALGVKLAAKSETITVEANKEKEVSDKEEREEANVIITIPAGAATESFKMSVTPYEEPQKVNSSLKTGKETIDVALKNIAVEATKNEFTSDLTVTFMNIASDNVYFENAEVYSQGGLARAIDGWEKENIKVTASNGNYHFDTKQLKAKYMLTIEAEKNTGAENKSEYNLVNGKNELKVDNSGNNSAMKDIAIKVEAKAGWEFTVNPTKALEDVGITGSDLTNMAATIKDIIEAQEGGFAKYYTVEYELKASVSGNHIMYYRNRAKFCEKAYTFDIVVKGGKNVKAVVKVKAYTGMEDLYQNEEATQHSGGKI